MMQLKSILKPKNNVNPQNLNTK